MHSFKGYSQSDDQPTAIQVFGGDSIAKFAPIVVDKLPGTYFRYSGDGISNFQVAMKDVSNKIFTQVMDELALKPARLRNSTYVQPLLEVFQVDVASGRMQKSKVEQGIWHNYPVQCPASLWTTPSESADFSLTVFESLTRGSKMLNRGVCTGVDKNYDFYKP